MLVVALSTDKVVRAVSNVGRFISQTPVFRRDSRARVFSNESGELILVKPRK
jgi:hypothetical protein